MADSRVGIELDGTRATLVEVTAGQAVQVRSYTGVSGADAVKQAVASLGTGRKTPPIRLSLVATTISVQPLDVSRGMLTDRKIFTDEVYKKMPRISQEATTVAGLLFNADSGTEAMSAGIAAAMPSDPVDEAYKVLPATFDVEVVPTPFVFSNADGLHLSIRYSNADLTLVVDGHPVAYRRLPGGGFDDLARTLGGDNGLERLRAASEGLPGSDLIAKEELSRYLRKLVEEVVKTTTLWKRNGLEVPDVVHPNGVGGRVVELVDHLSDVGYAVHAHDDLVRAMAYIPMGERELAVGAFLAGRSAGEGEPYSSFPSTVLLERAAARRAATRRSKRLGLIIAAVVLPLVSYLVPTTLGTGVRLYSEAQLADSQTRFDAVSETYYQLQDVEGLEGAYADLASADPVWNNVLFQGLQTAQQAGVAVENFSASNDGTTITVTAAGRANDPGATYAPLTSWLNALKDPAANVPAQGVLTTGFSHAPEQAESSFQVRYTVDVQDVVEDRNLGGTQ